VHAKRGADAYDRPRPLWLRHLTMITPPPRTKDSAILREIVQINTPPMVLGFQDFVSFYQATDVRAPYNELNDKHSTHVFTPDAAAF
jgi:hypothetical protein